MISHIVGVHYRCRARVKSGIVVEYTSEL